MFAASGGAYNKSPPFLSKGGLSMIILYTGKGDIKQLV
jgi:hypothetical protein